MKIFVKPLEPLDLLPDDLLIYHLQHKHDWFKIKSKPFKKALIPPGYIKNRNLCKQFDILPHSWLCLDWSLWRIEIVDGVTFDLSKELIQIDFINGFSSRYSFEQSHSIINSSSSRASSSSNSASQSAQSIKQKLILHLKSLHQIYQDDQAKAHFDLKRLLKMPYTELSILKKKLTPFIITPTTQQIILEAKLAQKHSSFTAQSNGQLKRRPRPSISTNQKSRKKSRLSSTVTSENQSIETFLKEPPIESFYLSHLDLFQIISQISEFRATLLDLFHSIVIGILKVELPNNYPLWVINSQILIHQKHFELDSIRFITILHDNQTLDRLQDANLPSSSFQSSLDELKIWCEDVHMLAKNYQLPGSIPCHHINQPEPLSSAETSLNEPLSIEGLDQIGIHNSIYSYPEINVTPSVDWTSDPKNFDDHTQSKLINSNPAFTFESASRIQIETNATAVLPSTGINMVNQKLHSNTFQQITPPLSPTSKGSFNHLELWTPPPPQSLFNLPLLAFEPDFLTLIRSGKSRNEAVEIITSLAERRLKIDELEKTFQVLSLLEEERMSNEEGEGLERLSDIITTSRLSAGWGEGHQLDLAEDVRIKYAEEKMKVISFGSDQSNEKTRRSPSKTSQSKRKLFVRRKKWLAVITRRLDRHWDKESELIPTWPEPIFLRKKGYKNMEKTDEMSLVSHDSSLEKPITNEIVKLEEDELGFGL